MITERGGEWTVLESYYSSNIDRYCDEGLTRSKGQAQKHSALPMAGRGSEWGREEETTYDVHPDGEELCSPHQQ